jgi:hypothetical protein
MNVVAIGVSEQDRERLEQYIQNRPAIPVLARMRRDIGLRSQPKRNVILVGSRADRIVWPFLLHKATGGFRGPALWTPKYNSVLVLPGFSRLGSITKQLANSWMSNYTTRLRLPVILAEGYTSLVSHEQPHLGDFPVDIDSHARNSIRLMDRTWSSLRELLAVDYHSISEPKNQHIWKNAGCYGSSEFLGLGTLLARFLLGLQLAETRSALYHLWHVGVKSGPDASYQMATVLQIPEPELNNMFWEFCRDF